MLRQRLAPKKRIAWYGLKAGRCVPPADLVGEDDLNIRNCYDIQ